MSTEITRLHGIGFRRFAITNLEPAGCLPFITAPKSMANCSRTDNVLSSVHNRILAQMLVTMRTFRGRDSKYIILDQYKTFLDVLSSSSDYGKIPLTIPAPPCSSQYLHHVEMFLHTLLRHFA